MDTTPIHHPRSVRITKSVLKACSFSAAYRLDQAGLHFPESPSLYVSNQGRYKRYFCASFRGHNCNSNYPIVFMLGRPSRVTRSFCHSYTEVSICSSTARVRGSSWVYNCSVFSWILLQLLWLLAKCEFVLVRDSPQIPAHPPSLPTLHPPSLLGCLPSAHQAPASDAKTTALQRLFTSSLNFVSQICTINSFSDWTLTDTGTQSLIV